VGVGNVPGKVDFESGIWLYSGVVLAASLHHFYDTSDFFGRSIPFS
jgi:hypothetical protein